MWNLKPILKVVQISCAFTHSLQGVVAIGRFDGESFDLAQLLLLLSAPAQSL
jgi:hypothetical protein